MLQHLLRFLVLSPQIKSSSSSPTITRNFIIVPLTHLSFNRAMGPSVSHIYGKFFSTLSLSHPSVPFDAWIIDIGATHHVCCNLSYFSHSTFKIPQSLFLMVMLLPFNQIGYVKLSNYLILHNVLFVPMFAFNFLSISALILDYNCCINFLSNSCVIQDLTQGLMIGKGRRHNNLYFPELRIVVCNSMFSCL